MKLKLDPHREVEYKGQASTLNNPRRSYLPLTLLAAILLTITFSGGSAQIIENEIVPVLETGVGSPHYLPIISKTQRTSTGPMFGVNFISSAEDAVDEQQYQNGLATGATWNRWPLYWFFIENNPGNFDWSEQDETVVQDAAHGLEIDAILLGTPLFYTTSINKEGDIGRPERKGNFELEAPQAAAPIGLHDPVFSDGSDIPGPGKSINPNNVWARFTYEAVNRYRPGGILAQTNNWPAGTGITHWEIWNEPDLSWFWDSSTGDYARLLKVGYMAVRQADPTAKVILGGLANFQKPTFYDDVLAIYQSDPLAQPYNYFHDILATHSYFNSWESWKHVYRASGSMAALGIEKSIWLNESGVPAWNDYPGPVWDPLSPWRATMSEQSDYIVQSTFYATFAGADAIFHFQLYDGCGNQPPGTDFPPHNGELCESPSYPICAGDAFGLFRNPTDAACFTQHPQPETPRPYMTTFQLLTTHFTGVEPLWRKRPGGPNPYEGPQEWIAFYRPDSNERIVGMWTLVRDPQTAVIDAIGSSGLILWPDGSSQVVYPSNGTYTLQLPGATNQNQEFEPDYVAIGGKPIMLIEADTIAPTVLATIDASAESVKVSWTGDDGLGSGIESYDIYVADTGDPFVPLLLGTSHTSTRYRSSPGHEYTFLIRVRDRAGNLSDSTHIEVVTPDY
jgi:hypothetical protein